MSTHPTSLQRTPKAEKLPTLVPAFFHELSDDEDISTGQNDFPVDIYQHLGIPPGTPISLDSLNNPPAGERPPYTYATLLKLAIWSSPRRMLTLSGIYAALEDRFAWFRESENPSSWKTTIRHTLSLMAPFIKIPSNVNYSGRGCFWTVDFSKGEGYKRPRRRGAKKQLTLEEYVSDTSTSITAPSESESPVDSNSSFSDNSHDFQIIKESGNGVSVPFPKTIALKAASPDPRYRHYRMCTYLYPQTGGASAKKPAREICDRFEDVAKPSESEPPAQPHRSQRKRASRPSNPTAKKSRRVRKASQRIATDETPPEVEYFCPSTASYLAYCAASKTYPSTFTFCEYKPPGHKSRSINGSDCSSIKIERESSAEDDIHGIQHAFAETTSNNIEPPFVFRSVLKLDKTIRNPTLAPLPLQNEVDEEDKWHSRSRDSIDPREK